MAPELRPRRSKATDAAPAEETPKSKNKTSKGPAKRKADEDVSPAATKKQKAAKTTSKDATSKDSAPTSKTKKAKTPVNAKNAKNTKEAAKDEVADSASSKTPKKGKAAEKAKEGQDKEVKATEKATTSTSKKAVASGKAKSTQKTEKTEDTKQNKAKASSEATTKTAPKQTKETSKTATGKKAPKTASKSAKKPEKKVEPAVVAEDEEGAASAQDDEQASSDDEEVDEQTKALVETVDSGEDNEPGSGVVLFEEGQDVGKIPEMTNKEKKAAKKALAAAKAKEESGVIYVGRLPHGFYEHEMKSYFSQFGPIRNLRLSRNKKTGRAKHFAFVEFEELSTAEIVAKTMDNYLLFGHILKCSVIPKAQVHDDLFKGGNKRFKPVPWNKMEGKQMERPLLEDKWTRKINKEKKRRADRAKKLETIGYDFAAPELMNVDAVPAIAEPVAEASTESPVKAIESAAAEQTVEGEQEQEATPKTAKRGRGRPSKTPQKAGKADTPKKAKK